MAVSWLKGMIDRVDAATLPPPTETMRAEVVHIPHGVDKLRRAIETVQREVMDKDLQLTEYRRAWAVAEKEYAAAVEKNRIEHGNANTRLEKLQTEWIEITKRLGIYAALPGAQMPDAPGIETGIEISTCPTAAEWGEPER